MRMCHAFKKCKSSNRNETTTSNTKCSPSISTPYDIKHPISVRYDYGRSRFEGFPLNDPSWNHINQHFGIPPANIPKIGLHGYTTKIPAVLVMLRKILLDNNGHLTPHIFREPPNKISRDAIKKQIDLGKFTNCQDCHVIADLIKLWLRELPTPLLSAFNIASMETILDEDEQQLQHILSNTMENLDKELLFWMADLMLSIAEHENINHMGVEQLCIVMAPSFYCMKTNNPLEAVSQSKITVQFLKKVLSYRRKKKHNI